MFGMGTGVSPPLQSPESRSKNPVENQQPYESGKERVAQRPLARDSKQGKFYGQASRLISTGKLHALPHFHIQPITW